MEFRNTFLTNWCIIFPVQKFSDFPKKALRTSNRDKQEVCSGYDDNGDVPVGCFLTKDDLMTMGVIHQQLILLQQEGRF
jgi:hypothetical protein